MPHYVITRKINDKEYYLKKLEHTKVIWIADVDKAARFDSESELNTLISRQFPKKDYYVTEHRDEDDWGIIIKPKGIV